MQSLAWILAFYGIGELAATALPIPVPGNVIGFVLLTAALLSGAIPESAVQPAASTLLDHLMLFFTPVVVGSVTYWSLLKAEAVPVLTSVVISTLISLIVTAALGTWARAEGDSNRESRADRLPPAGDSAP